MAIASMELDVPAARAGDTRLILLGGEPIEVDGRIAAVRRVRKAEDVRSNVHAGGSVERAEVTPGMLDKGQSEVQRDGRSSGVARLSRAGPGARLGR